LKKVYAIAGTVILLLSILLVGCSQENKKTPRDTLIEAFNKSAEIKTSKFEGSIKLNMELPDSALSDPSAAMAMNMLNNAELTFRGTSQLEPMMAEVFLTARVTGDTEFAINLPILMTENKLWLKIPNTPFLPLPENVTGKYLELDFVELAAMTGEEISTISPEQQQRYQQLGAEMAELLFGALEDGEYFTNVSKEDAGIPGDVDANQAVKFELTNDNLRPFIESLFKVLPALLDKVAELDEAGLSPSELESLKEELQMNEQELATALDEMEAALDIHNASMVTAVDKNGYVNYTNLQLDLGITSEGETGRIGLQVVVKQSEINQSVSFELQEPDASDVINIQELMTSMFMYGL
jgi:hypothetical protein